MNCYVCDEQEKSREAVGLCHHCSAGLCHEHTFVRPRSVITIVPLNREVALPIKARELLCPVCKAALEQPRSVAWKL